ncbi:hypothetical protein Tco_0056533 [Tanacetum coccineum]
MPRGTTQVVTRGASNDWCQMCRYEVRGGRASVRGTVAVRGVSTRQYEQSVRGRRVPIMGNNEAVGGVQKGQNTPRSSNMSGWRLERTKLPSPTLGYINKARSC